MRVEVGEGMATYLAKNMGELLTRLTNNPNRNETDVATLKVLNQLTRKLTSATRDLKLTRQEARIVQEVCRIAHTGLETVVIPKYIERNGDGSHAEYLARAQAKLFALKEFETELDMRLAYGK